MSKLLDEKSMVANLLYACNIGREAQGTTLTMLGHAALREYLSSPGMLRSTTIIQATASVGTEALPTNSVFAELVSEVACKELILLKHSTYFTSLAELCHAMFRYNEDYAGGYTQPLEQIQAAIRQADILCITEFCMSCGNAPPYFTPYESARLYGLLKSRLSSGKKLIVHTDRPFSRIAAEWWSSHMVGLLLKDAYIYSVPEGFNPVVQTGGKK